MNFTCKCGHTVVYTNEHRCEDCWALDQERWHGKDQSVDIKGVFRDMPDVPDDLRKNHYR